MSAKEDFVMAIKEGFGARVHGHELRPNIEVWPEEDDFGKWVASHEDKVRTGTCVKLPSSRIPPFCGRGYH